MDVYLTPRLESTPVMRPPKHPKPINSKPIRTQTGKKFTPFLVRNPKPFSEFKLWSSFVDDEVSEPLFLID